jgi:hypothetical protein
LIAIAGAAGLIGLLCVLAVLATVNAHRPREAVAADVPAPLAIGTELQRPPALAVSRRVL